MPKFAVIDLGSNSIRMTINEYKKNGEYKVLKNFQAMARLSAKMGKHHTLQKNAIGRTLKGLKKFKKELSKYPQIQLRAVATAAVRQAKNRQVLLKKFKEVFDQPLEVISGTQEAYFDYLGIINTFPIKDCLIIDTGGASTEIVLVKNGINQNLISLPLGAVNLTDNFFEKDKISAKSLFKATTFLNNAFWNIPWLNKALHLPIIAIGGSNRALAKISRQKSGLVSLPIHGYHLSDQEVRNIFEHLLSSNLKERVSIPGLVKHRADIIIGGLLPIIQLLQYINAEQVIFSQAGLRQGLLFEKIEKATGNKALSFRINNI